MGGDVHCPMACIIEVAGPYDIGKGQAGYLVVAPNGQTFVAEGETGALVGPTMEEVREDIRVGDQSVIDEQMEYARRESKKAEVVTVDEFWRILKCEATNG
jgi:hypothetical protein